jgi:hypothetical protein
VIPERRASALSSAAPEAVWDVLLDGRRWSFWNSGIEWLWLEGEPVAGTLATIKARGMRQTALVIEEALHPQRFALGVTIGPVARMRVTWTLEALPTGTRIDAAVAIEGIAAGLLLKRRAERIAAALPVHLENLAARAALGPLEREPESNAARRD